MPVWVQISMRVQRLAGRQRVERPIGTQRHGGRRQHGAEGVADALVFFFGAQALRRRQAQQLVRQPLRGHVRRVKQRQPELRVVPRTSVENVEAMLEAGAEGAVVSFPDEAAMRELAGRYR